MAVLINHTIHPGTQGSGPPHTRDTSPRYDPIRSVLPAQDVAAICSSNPGPKRSNVVPAKTPSTTTQLTKTSGPRTRSKRSVRYGIRTESSTRQQQRLGHFSLQPPKLNLPGDLLPNPHRRNAPPDVDRNAIGASLSLFHPAKTHCLAVGEIDLLLPRVLAG